MVCPLPGDRVLHERLGPGTVLRRRFGHSVQVSFDGAPELPRTMPASEFALAPSEQLEPARSKPTRSSVEVPTSRSKPQATRARARSKPRRRPEPLALRTHAKSESTATPIEIADRRQTLEALRLGVVPARHLADYTVARERELTAYDTLLTARRGFLGIIGEYGAGKTHLLDLFEQQALERNFLVARVTVDPSEHTATHPKRLYRALVEALRYPGDGGRGLDPLMHRLVDSDEHRKSGGESASRFFSPYLWAIAHGDEDVLGWVRDWILGDRIEGHVVDSHLRQAGWRGKRVLTLSDYRTYGRVYMHLLGTLANWARDAGFEGLLLLFDEVEFVDGLNAEAFGYALEVLRHVAAVTAHEDHLAFDPEALYRGGHQVHKSLPLRSSDDQPLGAVCALTPLRDDAGHVLRSLVTKRDLELRLAEINSRDTLHLVQRITEFYCHAHPGFDPPRATCEHFIRRIHDVLTEDGASPRDVVQATVCELDGLRCGDAARHDDG